VNLRAVALRVGVALVTLAFVLVFNFFMIRAAGDPEKDLARNPRLDAEAQEAVIRERGLDQSTFVQFQRYVEDTLTLDLGTSFNTQQPVWDELKDALPNTLLVVGVGTVLASILGTLIGAWAGARRGSPRDTALTQGSLVLYSMPEFWLGMLLIYIFSVKLGWFPSALKQEPGARYDSTLDEWWDIAKHAFLPILTLTLGLLAQYALVMRASLTNVLHEDFIVTARALGNTRKRVMRRHAVRNALLPVITVIGLNLGLVLGGVIAIEALFSWPGLGTLALEGIEEKDYPLLQGLFLLTASMVIVFNLIVDLTYSYLDPRVRTA
jgi:peptide/nickel transport system permease protein